MWWIVAGTTDNKVHLFPPLLPLLFFFFFFFLLLLLLLTSSSSFPMISLHCLLTFPSDKSASMGTTTNSTATTKPSKNANRNNNHNNHNNHNTADLLLTNLDKRNRERGYCQYLPSTVPQLEGYWWTP